MPVDAAPFVARRENTAKNRTRAACIVTPPPSPPSSRQHNTMDASSEFQKRFRDLETATGVPADWTSLTYYPRCNDTIVTDLVEDSPMPHCFYKVGHTLTRQGKTGTIEWTGWTIEDARLQRNHTVLLRQTDDNGLQLRDMSVNCFGWGWRRGEDYDYLQEMLEELTAKARAGDFAWDRAV